MAELKKPKARAKPRQSPAAGAKASRDGSADGYQGIDWPLYERVRPHKRHTGATGAGLVEYTLWFEVLKERPDSLKADVGLPGQPVR